MMVGVVVAVVAVAVVPVMEGSRSRPRSSRSSAATLMAPHKNKSLDPSGKSHVSAITVRMLSSGRFWSHK